MIYFYVDDNGSLQSTSNSVPAVGFHYEFEQKSTYMNIMVVHDRDGEVHSEYQGWTSLHDLCKAIGKAI